MAGEPVQYAMHEPAEVLLHPCAASLDEQNQHDHEEHAGNNADDCYIVHFQVLLNLPRGALFKMLQSGLGATDCSAIADLFPASGLGERASFHCERKML